MRRPLIILITLMMLLCLSGIAVAQEEEQKISTRDEALSHAAKLFPEIIKGKENTLQISLQSSQYPSRDVWEITFIQQRPGPDRTG